MPFQDIPKQDPYLRLFTEGQNIRSIIFSSHGIWNPAEDGMTRLNYTYYWYTQPTATLTYQQYVTAVQTMGASPPTDSFGPDSGEVANMLLLPLDQQLFALTAKAFQERMRIANPQGLALLAFQGNKAVPAMRLNLLDKQLLPALRYPLETPVHMVVCRSLNMSHVTPVVQKDVVVISDAITPFDSITNDMP